MFKVFGTELGPSAGRELPSISVAVAGTTLEATVITASPGEVVAILPTTAPTGEATVTISSSGQSSAPVSFVIVQNAFGIFARNQAGSGPGIVQNFRSASDQRLNTFVEAAQPGQVMTLWGTGLGIEPPEGAVEVLTGSKLANIRYAGPAGCCAGLDQIVFELPPDVELGCYVPVVVRAGSMISNFVTISISATEGSCFDPGGLPAKDLELIQSGRNISFGSIVLSWDVSRLWFYPDWTDQYFSAGFFQENPLRPLGPVAGAPPSGTCVVYTIPDKASVQRPDVLANDPLRLTALDAGGALRLMGPGGVREIAKGPNGTYLAHPVITPGFFTLDNTIPLRPAGGADVGEFSVSLRAPSAVAWNESDFLANDAYSCPNAGIWDLDYCIIERSKGLTVTWRDVDPSLPVTIRGQNDLVSATRPYKVLATTYFHCTERAAAGKFSVPPAVLMSLPAGPPVGGPWATESLSVGHRFLTSFTAAGLDVGYIVSQGSRSVLVYYQ